ncbi:hypothetical protein PGT21_013331 [Puccinia graminis f. sp. tritici]|uniref:Uncharacterized protein n=1 Tax=Puccinia graminis f. sp. tritici TaxID=56615 RepID=A0A5B0Q2K0_PUCGR|nr:hypothetical protein PGT21_013331 [Puccinia graminis f. sp. tritici]
MCKTDSIYVVLHSATYLWSPSPPAIDFSIWSMTKNHHKEDLPQLSPAIPLPKFDFPSEINKYHPIGNRHVKIFGHDTNPDDRRSVQCEVSRQDALALQKIPNRTLVVGLAFLWGL